MFAIFKHIGPQGAVVDAFALELRELDFYALEDGPSFHEITYPDGEKDRVNTQDLRFFSGHINVSFAQHRPSSIGCITREKFRQQVAENVKKRAGKQPDQGVGARCRHPDSAGFRQGSETG